MFTDIVGTVHTSLSINLSLSFKFRSRVSQVVPSDLCNLSRLGQHDSLLTNVSSFAEAVAQLV